MQTNWFDPSWSLALECKLINLTLPEYIVPKCWLISLIRHESLAQKNILSIGASKCPPSRKIWDSVIGNGLKVEIFTQNSILRGTAKFPTGEKCLNSKLSLIHHASIVPESRLTCLNCQESFVSKCRLTSLTSYEPNATNCRLINLTTHWIFINILENTSI